MCKLPSVASLNRSQGPSHWGGVGSWNNCYILEGTKSNLCSLTEPGQLFSKHRVFNLRLMSSQWTIGLAK
jgi:hypothetical protein